MKSLILFLAGVYLFSTAFLQSRRNLENTSKPTAPPLRSKAIIVILDALRFDFTQPSNSSTPLLFQNNLKILHKLSTQNPENAILLRAKADPPTTTLQRLEAIMTGSLPTFIDVSMNFADKKVNVDNLVWQMKNEGKKVVFMGDDTWLSLFKKEVFLEVYPFPSFEVWDLHSVDNGVVSLLYDKIKEPSWDVIVAHFLGVDHAGHRYGPNHIEMKNKLMEANTWLERLFDTIDNDTVVFVLGDHGMDEKGDHGGDGPLEIDTTTFIYSKTPLFASSIDKKYAGFWKLVKQTIKDNFDDSLNFFEWDGHRSISQIDFVPSFALLLGLPIPFGNFGSLIPELLLAPSPTSRNPMHTLLKSTSQNSIQMFEYLKLYSTHSRDLGFDKLTKLYETASKKSSQYFSKENKSPKTIKLAAEVYAAHLIFQRKSLLAARKVWAQFNLCGMGIGIGFIVLAILVAGVDGQEVVGSFDLVLGWFFGSVVLITVTFETFGYVYLGTLVDIVGGVEYLSAGVFGIVFFVVWCFNSGSRLLQVDFLLLKSPENLFILFLYALHILTPASDSYTYWEDSVSFYLLQTLLFTILFTQYSKKRNVDFIVSVLILTRLSTYFTICRFEQGPSCEASFNGEGNFIFGGSEEEVLGWYFLASFTSLVMYWRLYQRNGVFRGFCVPFFHFVAFFYAGLNTIENNVGKHREGADVDLGKGGIVGVFVKHFERDHGIMLVDEIGEIKYLFGRFVLFPVFVLSCFGLLIDHFNHGKDDKKKSNKQISSKQKRTNSKHFQTTFGILTIIHLTSLITQKPIGGIPLQLGYTRIALLLTTSLPNPLCGPLLFHLLGLNIFFTTGHQTQFSAIQMEVGFVGLKQVNWIITPMLIFLNTFGGYVMAVVGVTLLWRKRRGLFRSFVYVAVLVSAGTVAGFRRHLMVWSVFAPRYIFGGLWGVVGVIVYNILEV